MATTRNNQSGLALKLFLFLVAVGVASATSEKFRTRRHATLDNTKL